MIARLSGFHSRTAALNPCNEWVNANGVSVPARFMDAREEAVAARMSVVLSDISWRSQYLFEGAGAAACMSRLFTRETALLEPGRAVKALWLNDAGAVRGAGVVARLGPNTFKLITAADDSDWLLAAAGLFGVAVADCPEAACGLALVGPESARMLKAEGLDFDLAPLTFVRKEWRGIAITQSRFGEYGGYEIWCRREDAHEVWDRLVESGKRFSLCPAGAQAMQTLDLETGVARPFRDYIPARSTSSPEPAPAALGVEALVDSAHRSFNGYRAWAETRLRPQRRIIAGLRIEDPWPAPFAALERDGEPAGTTLSSCYSPSLQTAIALAEIDVRSARSGTILTLQPPLSLEHRTSRRATAEVVDLPFLPPPDPIPA